MLDRSKKEQFLMDNAKGTRETKRLRSFKKTPD